jgi:hypothetical protein
VGRLRVAKSSRSAAPTRTHFPLLHRTHRHRTSDCDSKHFTTSCISVGKISKHPSFFVAVEYAGPQLGKIAEARASATGLKTPRSCEHGAQHAAPLQDRIECRRADQAHCLCNRRTLRSASISAGQSKDWPLRNLAYRRRAHPATATPNYFSSPANSEKSAIVVNSRSNSASSARRLLRTASSSAITITSRKNWSTALRRPAISSSAS